MGPAAWAAVGRALSIALASSLFTRQNNLVIVTARSINRAILNNELQMAEAMLRDLAFRHRESFDEFIRKYRGDLPDELFEEFADLL